MTKECKYNDFSVRFYSQNENETGRGKYDMSMFHEGVFDREIMWYAKNQIVFDANEYLQQLGNCEKFIILEKGIDISLLWTSFKGNPEKISMKGGTKYLFDYLFLTFSKKKQKCLYIGSCVDAPIAAWRNQINLDVMYQANIIDEFLKQTTETYLPF